MNKIFIIGNLTFPPKSGVTQSNIPYCTFTVAVNPRFGGDDKPAQFFNVTAWRGLSESCAKYLDKGKKVAVVGELTARTYTAKDGSAKVALEISADEVEFLSPRESVEGAGYQRQQPAPQTTADGFTELEEISRFD